MGKMESVMRDEIARLARREVKAAADPLRKEVRELRKAVVELKKSVTKHERVARKVEQAEKKKLTRLSVDEDEAQAARINAKWVKTLRSKLNVSQAELAALLGISVSGVRTWEYDISRPRGKNRASLVALRKLGRRDVKKMLEDLAAS